MVSSAKENIQTNIGLLIMQSVMATRPWCFFEIQLGGKILSDWLTGSRWFKHLCKLPFSPLSDLKLSVWKWPLWFLMFHLISHPCHSSCDVCTNIIFCAAGAVSKPKDTGWCKKWKWSDSNQKRGCCFFPQRFHKISKIIIFQQFRQALLTLHKLFKATPNYKPSVRLHFGDPEINVQ